MTRDTASPDGWSVPLAVADIPDAGGHYDLVADAAARDAIAKAAGLRGLPQLKAVFDVTVQGEHVLVTGEVKAHVEQTCVVTLEPIENDVAEAVDLVFAPQGPSEDAPKKGKEPPEPLIGGAIDLGAVATEFLMLGVDPYPRKAGVEFGASAGDAPGESPFAALKALKNRPKDELK